MICIHDKKNTKVNFDNNDFGIKEKMLQSSLRNQITSLTEFDNSFNAYCNGVRDIEENICSVFSKISRMTEEISLEEDRR